MAVFGALTGLTALATPFVGIMLAAGVFERGMWSAREGPGLLHAAQLPTERTIAERAQSRCHARTDCTWPGSRG